jgi:hypothetical protein
MKYTDPNPVTIMSIGKVKPGSVVKWEDRYYIVSQLTFLDCNGREGSCRYEKYIDGTIVRTIIDLKSGGTCSLDETCNVIVIEHP